MAAEKFVRRKVLRKESGFTLIEVLVALLIVLPALFGVIGVTIYMMQAGDTSRGVVTALQDANAVIERIRSTSESGLTEVVQLFPAGQPVGGFANLDNELIRVSYPNPTQDPLQITVTVTWTNRGRLMQRSLFTQITQR